MKELPASINKIKEFLEKFPLPGLDVQLEMAPNLRSTELKIFTEKDKAIKSAILILMYQEDNQLHTCFILRPTYDGIHSGQIGFPGGKAEKSDKNLIETAIREAEEEIGVDAKKIEIIGVLSDLFIPPSNFIVKPVIGFIKKKPQFVLDNYEVEELILIKISDLLKPESRKESEIFEVGKKSKIYAPCFQIDNHRIWGATAMIISEFLEVLKLSGFKE